MNRRDFIVKLPVLFAFPLIIQQIGCDNSTNPMSSDNGDDNGNGNGTGNEDIDFSITSSVNGGHSHSVKILYNDVEMPSATNKTLTSSSTGHTHQITLSTANYQALSIGETIVKTSTTNGGHSHTFSVKVP
ncbi:MAG: hypothetical protein V3W20_01640 [Candidatus Neomarinimicrobiota bacterium]